MLLRYKNNSQYFKQYYGQMIKPGAIAFVPGPIHDPYMQLISDEEWAKQTTRPIQHKPKTTKPAETKKDETKPAKKADEPKKTSTTTTKKTTTTKATSAKVDEPKADNAESTINKEDDSVG